METRMIFQDVEVVMGKQRKLLIREVGKNGTDKDKSRDQKTHL
jgi:hypothetical protein